MLLAGATDTTIANCRPTKVASVSAKDDKVKKNNKCGSRKKVAEIGEGLFQCDLCDGWYHKVWYRLPLQLKSRMLKFQAKCQ